MLVINVQCKDWLLHFHLSYMLVVQHLSSIGILEIASRHGTFN